MDEEFIVITKHEMETSSAVPAMPKCLSDQIVQNIDNFLSHSTRTFRLGSTVHYLTQIRMRSNEVTIQNEHPLLLEACKRDGVDDFGSGPLMGPEDCQVMFVLCPKSLVHSDNPNLANEFDHLIYDCLLHLNGRYYQTQNLSSSAADVLKKVEPWCRSSDEVCGLAISQINLLLSHYPPKFTYLNYHVIASPGLEVSDYLRLIIEFRNPPWLIAYAFRSYMILSRVVMELYELRTCVGGSGGNPALSSIARGVKKMTLVDNSCRRWILVFPSKVSCCHVPVELYKCTLPSLGPTFSSANMTRSYAIKVSVMIESEQGHFKSTLSAFMNIRIAKEVNSERETPLFRIAKEVYPRNDKSQSRIPLNSIMNYFTLTRRIPLNHYEPINVASDILSTVSTFGQRAYHEHETRAFRISDEILTTSCFALMVPTTEMKESRKTAYPDVIASSECDDIGEALRYEVYPAAPTRKWFAGGTRVNRNNSNLRCDRTPGWLSLSGLDSYLELPAIERFASTTLEPTSLQLLLSFRRTSFYTRDIGDHVVMPRMKLLEFAELQFLHPKPISTERPENNKLLVRNFAVKIEELHTINCIPNRSPLIVSRELLNKSCRYGVEWKRARISTKHNPEMCVLTFPTRLFDCTIPDLKPTFYSNERSRRYRLKLEVTLTHGARAETLVVGLPLKVAADLTGYRWWGRYFIVRCWRQTRVHHLKRVRRPSDCHADPFRY